jgi:FkbM family methyltransferase
MKNPIYKVRFFLHKLKKSQLTKKEKILSIFRYIKNHLGFFNKPKIINWIRGLRYYYQKGDASFSDNYFFKLADYEDSSFLINYARKTDLFLDIGANHGHYSILLAGLCETKCIAIEPVSCTFNKLKKNINLNNLDNLVSLKQFGLSNSTGKLFFSNDLGTMNKIVDEDYKNKVEIDVLTIDDLDIDISIIKIDVEGYEFNVLQGAKNTLSKKALNIIVCEVNNTINEDSLTKDLLNYLEIYDFKPYVFQNNLLVEISGNNKDDHNTIFIRDLDLALSRIKDFKCPIRN